MLKTLIQRVLPNRTFSQHFQVLHEFHGVIQHFIEETYTIRPITTLGLQTLLDGIQISNQNLHLKSKIKVQGDSIKISLKVIDPSESREIIDELKRVLVKQLLNFEKRFYSSPVVQYVEKFCAQCVHYESKPLNQCIANCKFQENYNQSTK